MGGGRPGRKHRCHWTFDGKCQKGGCPVSGNSTVIGERIYS